MVIIRTPGIKKQNNLHVSGYILLPYCILILSGWEINDKEKQGLWL